MASGVCQNANIEDPIATNILKHYVSFYIKFLYAVKKEIWDDMCQSKYNRTTFLIYNESADLPYSTNKSYS